MKIDQCQERLTKLKRVMMALYILQRMKISYVDGLLMDKKWQSLSENMNIPRFLEILIQESSITMTIPHSFRSFKEHYNRLINKFEKPFPCNSDENNLIQLDTRNVMGKEVVKIIQKIQGTGKLQRDTFISEKVVTKTCCINAPIRKNKLSLFSAANTLSSQTTPRKGKQDLQKGLQMFSQLFFCLSRKRRKYPRIINH